MLAQTSMTVGLGLRKSGMPGFEGKKSDTGYHAGIMVTAFDTIGIPVFTPT